MTLENLKTLKEYAYPAETWHDHLGYGISAASYVTLFVLNFLSISGVYHAPDLPWMSFGLAGGSFAFALMGGALKKWKFGLIREVAHTLPLMVITLLGGLGVGSVGSGSNASFNLSLGVLVTQGISSLYYPLGLCIGARTLKNGAGHILKCFGNKKMGQAIIDFDNVQKAKAEQDALMGHGNSPPSPVAANSSAAPSTDRIAAVVAGTTDYEVDI